MTLPATIGPLWLVRHSLPVEPYGSGAICYGSLDIDVEPKALAESVETLHRELPDNALIITSPMRRCLALAEALHERAQTRRITTDPRLRELDFGRWEGLGWDAIDRDALDAWAGNFMSYREHGGEAVNQLAERIAAVLEDIASRKQIQQTAPTVIVTHNGPIRMIKAITQSGRATVGAMPGLRYGQCERLSG
ncbi:MAG: phosphoglycerate kinase [Burkholderiales bacterium]|nr:MAG: phosphoglycerate kinase [Betaproteobacteria bacterium]TAG24077.1 MAG: phosphoglycerate kinase [Burkholderiales bacterium]